MLEVGLQGNGQDWDPNFYLLSRTGGPVLT